MGKQIKFRFKELRAIKERVEDRKYSLRDIADRCKAIDKELNITPNPVSEITIEKGKYAGTKRKVDQSGISTATLTKISNNDSKSIHLTTINLLCEFFDCDIGDLLIRE